MAKLSFYELVRDYSPENEISKTGPTVYPSHFHQTTEITYILQGQCHSVVNNKIYDIFPGDILFVPNYYPHSYATSLDTKRYTLMMQTEYTLFSNKQTFPCHLSDKKFNKEKILPLLQEIHALHKNPDNLADGTRKLLLKGYFDVFNGRLLQGYGDLLVPRDKQINTLIKILSYIEENSHEDLTLDFLADQFGYNKYYFSKYFNASIGDNLRNYINNTRIRKFIQLYKTSPHQNVLTLAFEVGFDSATSFYRAFHNAFNCTPKEFFNQSHR
ncbi:MAG: helix-turn-helix transcriptional regulator [Clostridia bacterium]|nr:helix-turn-helix transcriptional regulator [Clostridia bacterium]